MVISLQPFFLEFPQYNQEIELNASRHGSQAKMGGRK